MTSFTTKAVALTVLVLTSSNLAIAHAQVLDDIENAVTRGNQYNDTIDQFSERDTVEADEASIDGEAGVYVLKKNEIFSIKAIAGTGFSDNPSRTFDSDSDGSAAAQFAISTGVDTRVNQQVDAGANLVLSGTEYEQDGAPDSRNLVANAYVGKSFFDGEYFASVSASYGQAMNGTFDDGTAFYGLNASVTTLRPIATNVVFRPRLTVSRQWSEVSEQENTSATAAAEVIWAPAPKWRVSGSVSYSHRIYDDFFEDVTFVERKDDVWRASMGVSRQVNEKVVISVNATYVDQRSDFFLSEYEAFDGGISVNLQKRF